MGVVAFQPNFICKNSWWSSPLGHSFPTTDWQSAFFILFITWKGKCVCVCVCERERERERQRERNPVSFKEKINCHGKKKKPCTIKKKKVYVTQDRTTLRKSLLTFCQTSSQIYSYRHLCWCIYTFLYMSGKFYAWPSITCFLCSKINLGHFSLWIYLDLPLFTECFRWRYHISSSGHLGCFPW